MNENWFLKYEYVSQSMFDIVLGLNFKIYFFEDKSYIFKKNGFINEETYFNSSKISNSNFDILKSKIENIVFPQNLTEIGFLDGYESYITIKSNGNVKRYGGCNPQNKEYLKLENIIQDIIGFNNYKNIYYKGDF